MDKFTSYFQMCIEVKNKEKLLIHETRLHFIELKILSCIFKSNNYEMHAKKLNDNYFLSSTLKTRYINNLKDNDYISKKRCEEDERQLILYLTNSQIDKAYETFIKVEKILSKIDNNEIKSMLDILLK